MNIHNNENVFSLTRAGFNWPELTEKTDFNAELVNIGTGQPGGLDMQTGFVEPAQFNPVDPTIGRAVIREDTASRSELSGPGMVSHRTRQFMK